MPGACELRPCVGPTIKRPCATLARWVGRATNTADQYRSEPLQVPGSTSAGRVICGTDLAECISVPGDFLRPRGPFPQAYNPFGGGWVHRPAPEAPLIRENADRAVGIFWIAGRVSVTTLRPEPPKKMPCATLARLVGRATNTADQYRCYPNCTRLLTFSM